MRVTCSMRVHVAWRQDIQDTTEPRGLDPPCPADNANSLESFCDKEIFNSYCYEAIHGKKYHYFGHADLSFNILRGVNKYLLVNKYVFMFHVFAIFINTGHILFIFSEYYTSIVSFHVH